MGRLCFKRGKTTRRSRLNWVLLVSEVIIFGPGTVCGAHSKGAVFTYMDPTALGKVESHCWRVSLPGRSGLWRFGLQDVRMCHRKRTISVWRSAADPAKLEGRCLEWQRCLNSVGTIISGLWGYYVSYPPCQCRMMPTNGLHLQNMEFYPMMLLLSKNTIDVFG